MLSNLIVAICGIMLSAILFVAAGNGIIVPKTYTRIAKAPEIGRPMMQAVVTNEPVPAQLNITAAEHHDQEPGQLRQQTAAPVSEPDSAQHDVPAPTAVPTMPPTAVPVANTDRAGVAAAQPAGALATEPGAEDVAAPSAPAADIAASPQPEGATAVVTSSADAVENGPTTAPAAGTEAETPARTSPATASEPRGTEGEDAAADNHDTAAAPSPSVPARKPASTARAPARLRHVRPVTHSAPVAAHKPVVVRHARAHVLQPAPTPAVAAVPNAGPPIPGLFGQANFNTAPSPPHQ